MKNNFPFLVLMLVAAFVAAFLSCGSGKKNTSKAIVKKETARVLDQDSSETIARGHLTKIGLPPAKEVRLESVEGGGCRLCWVFQYNYNAGQQAYQQYTVKIKVDNGTPALLEEPTALGLKKAKKIEEARVIHD